MAIPVPGCTPILPPYPTGYPSVPAPKHIPPPRPIPPGPPGDTPPPGPVPPPCPEPVDPGVIISEKEKDRYDRAFITIDSYLDLDSLIDDDLHDGKLVRIQHLESGGAGFVIWNAETHEWDEFNFDAAIISISNEEIDEICT